MSDTNPSLSEAVEAFIGPRGMDVLNEIAEDPTGFLNAYRVPENAGEYAEALGAILRRIPKGWGRWIDCGPGWYPLIVEADQRIAQIDPDYAVFQIKEKFGSLRYYHDLTQGDTDAAFRIENEVCQRSQTICEECGAPGRLRGGGWIQTLCDVHAGDRQTPSGELMRVDPRNVIALVAIARGEDDVEW